MPAASMRLLTDSPQSFDNRDWRRALYMRVRGRQGYPHFQIQIAGKKIVYCYIRKNACSAFKKLILDHSPHVAPGDTPGHVIGFLMRQHRAVYPDDLRDADHVIFVHRDPIERILSLYRNKFIQQAGSKDIFASYHQRTGLDPQQASFHNFVFDYLQAGFRGLDPHTWPQRRHLLPVIYTDALPIESLHTGMTGIIGQDLADRYFAKARNATQTVYQEAPMPGAAQRPAGELHAILQESGTMPATTAFLTPSIRDRLTEIYAQDICFLRQR